ncbi:Clr5 domain-containing protein [Phaeosphaeriaceae sp. PMI808]|nr:Clr5 domain-containing protein [Phaeosphaeriaceae sp. PMI808]
MDSPPRSLPDLVPVHLPQLGFPYTGDHYPLSQQAYGLYGGDRAFASTLQAQLPSGLSATTHLSTPHPFSLSTALPSHEQHDAESAGNSQSAFVAPASPMGPPARPRKRKAPTLRANVWEPYKDRILDLHITQGLVLPKVRQMMEEEYGFKAELRQYRTRISQWGKDKNFKLQEMEAIVRKRQKRKLIETDKGQLIFEVRGRQVKLQNIERWMKRHEVAESFLYAPSPAACKSACNG